MNESNDYEGLYSSLNNPYQDLPRLDCKGFNFDRLKNSENGAIFVSLNLDG